MLFSTLIGGSDYGSAVTALAIDNKDNVYIAGATTSATFPVSANAFQRSGGGLLNPADSNSQRITSSFLMKISNAGDQLLYSTYLGGKTSGDAVAYGLAVDDQGRATIAGDTLQTDFPVTPGAYETVCQCDAAHRAIFVSRFNADGSGLDWSTFVVGVFGPGPYMRGLVLDADGNTTVAGTTHSPIYPVTSGALQSAYPVNVADSDPLGAGFISVISSDGSKLLHSTYFGGSHGATVNALTRDSEGNLWVTGEKGPVYVTGGNIGVDYVAEIDSSLSRVVLNHDLPNGVAGQVIRPLPNRRLALGGATFPFNAFSETVLLLSEDTPRGPEVWGVAGSAQPVVSGNISPGELISIYGVNLGPDPAQQASLNAAGRVGTNLHGYRVLVNGIEAPLLYTGANQINLVVPFRVAIPGDAVIQVISPDGTSAVVTGLQVVPSSPQIFPVIVNQDGTINSQSNPAPRGSIVTFWPTGGGLMDVAAADGEISQPPLGKLLLPVDVGLSRASPHDHGDVTYAGAAPGMVAGVVQVNFRVPPARDGHGTCHSQCQVTLTIGDKTSLQPDPVLFVPN